MTRGKTPLWPETKAGNDRNKEGFNCYEEAASAGSVDWAVTVLKRALGEAANDLTEERLRIYGFGNAKYEDRLTIISRVLPRSKQACTQAIRRARRLVTVTNMPPDKGVTRD